jgi:hypothetical protein
VFLASIALHLQLAMKKLANPEHLKQYKRRMKINKIMMMKKKKNNNNSTISFFYFCYTIE